MDVLVVDSDGDNAEFIRRLLKIWFPSLSVSVAITSDDALERVHVDAPSIVLTNFHMSGVDGLEFARRLQSRFGSSVKVVIITEENSDLIPKELVDGILTRPFSIDRLYRLVNTLHRRLSKGEA